MDTLSISREATLPFSFFISSLSQWSTLKETKSFLEELSPSCHPFFLSRKTNRNSQKLFLFVKMTDKHGCVPIHLKTSGSLLHLVGKASLRFSNVTGLKLKHKQMVKNYFFGRNSKCRYLHFLLDLLWGVKPVMKNILPVFHSQKFCSQIGSIF